jgi:hypothetical protein
MAPPLTVERFTSATAFLDAVEPWLLDNEVDANVVYSVARLLASGDHPFGQPVYYAAVKSAARIVGCALRPPPDTLCLSGLPAGGASRLVDGVAALYRELDGVSGPENTALEFARAWTRVRGGRWQARHRWTLFHLDHVREPSPAPGRLRLAEQRDWPVLRRWAPRYARDVNTRVDVDRFFDQMFRRGCLYVWEDTGPKCVVAVSGVTPNARRISAVYTPDEFRSRGYAANAVASACREALHDGSAFCVLFADREPSPPSRIYRRIGFEPLDDHLVIDLIP